MNWGQVLKSLNYQTEDFVFDPRGNKELLEFICCSDMVRMCIRKINLAAVWGMNWRKEAGRPIRSYGYVSGEKRTHVRNVEVETRCAN